MWILIVENTSVIQSARPPIPFRHQLFRRCNPSPNLIFVLFVSFVVPFFTPNRTASSPTSQVRSRRPQGRTAEASNHEGHEEHEGTGERTKEQHVPGIWVFVSLKTHQSSNLHTRQFHFGHQLFRQYTPSSNLTFVLFVVPFPHYPNRQFSDKPSPQSTTTKEEQRKYLTTKDTKSTKGQGKQRHQRTKRFMPSFNLLTLKFISSPVLTPANFM